MISIRTILSIIFSLNLLINTAFADNLLPNAGNFIRAGANSDNPLTTAGLMQSIDSNLSVGLVSILKLLYQVGVIVAVCVVLFMGIKLIIASPQQKAQLKTSLTPYFVGLLLFIAGVPIAILIINIIISIF